MPDNTRSHVWLTRVLRPIVGAADDRSVGLKVKTAATAAFALATLFTGRRAHAEAASASFQPQLPAYQTQHYILHTDVGVEFADDLGLQLDAMHDEYTRRLGAFGATEDGRRDVWVFTRKSDYVRFIDDRLPNTGGVFIPSKKCLAAYLEGQGRDALRRTLRHEAFHQFAFEVIGPNLPVWLNEGIAQVFEEGIYAGNRFLIEQVPPRRLRQLGEDMRLGRLVPFDDFVFMDHKTWATNMRDRDRGATQYNQAWAMVHFLVYARDRDGSPLYRQRFFDMLTAIRDGTPAEKAFTDQFTTNFRGFERRFTEYARALQPTPEATFMENAEVLSDMMVEIFGAENRTFRSVIDLRRHLERGKYQLKYTKGSLRWTTNPNIGLYFKDAEGRDMAANEVGLVANPGAPLSDLVMRPMGNLEYRARFYTAPDGKPDREILVTLR